jgi:predicted transcriptional regulator
MRVLWDRPGSTVGEVVERIADNPKPAYNSVLTILRILESKGYVTHEKQGRAFVYAPVVDGQQARRGALTQLLTRFFNGSREQLVMDLFGHEAIDAEELRKVRALLDRQMQSQRTESA